MKDIYLKDLKENGYICIENIIPKKLIKENLIQISKIGGHLVKNFRLNKMKDVKAANKKNFYYFVNLSVWIKTYFSGKRFKNFSRLQKV